MNSAARQTAPSVAQIIRDQLGGKALFMMGAYNLMGLPDALAFKIRGSKFCTTINIRLDAATDTYTISFWKGVGVHFREVESCADIYVEKMHELISEKTSLYLSL